MIEQLIQACQWDTAQLLIFSGNTYGPLIYYSHLTAIVVALLFGFFMILNNRKDLISKILFFITITFSLWSYFDLILWANEKSELIMFFWAMLILLEPVIYASCLYAMYLFFDKNDVTLNKKLIIGVLTLPVVFLLPTQYSLLGFDLTDCDRVALEGPLVYYAYFIELIFVLWMLVLIIKRYIKATKEFRKQIILISVGMFLFLVAFSWGNLIQSLTENWIVGQYGLFGMPILVAFLIYIIVRFRVFNIRLIGAQALIVALWLLVLGILFLRNIENVRAVTIVTLLLVTIAGFLLVKSVKKEVQQREELAKLNIDLQKSIKARESLTHLVTHKVKGYFTRTKCVFAEMIEGSFGVLPPKAKEMAAGGLASDNEGIAMVDMVLNQASLQAGLIKYDMKPFDFKGIVKEIIEEKRGPAEKKGLKMETDIKDENYAITGDQHWLKEAILNLVDNAVKCTVTGKITVGLGLKEKQVFFYVKDTGRGITDEDRKNLYTEGGRGKDSLKYNPDSTGYGLSTVKLIVEAHKGKVWEDTEVGKGSTFYVKLPLTQK